MREHGGAIPEGILRTVVPAAPHAWITALARYGTMSFSEVAQSAIGFARDGFVMYPLMAELLETYAESYARWPSSAAIYLPGGRPPKVGDLFVQSDLGRTLQYMADCETAARGRGRVEGLKAARNAFYQGDIARTIVAFHEQNGGLLSMQDLANFQVGMEPAVSANFRGSTMYACGPWCQGPALLQMLTMLEGVDLASLGHNSSAYVHTPVETIKLSFADRHRCFGAPRFTDVPLGSLLDPAYTAGRRGLIDPRRAWPDMPPAGDLHSDLRIEGRILAAPKRAALDTSYLPVIDRRGNVPYPFVSVHHVITE